MHWFSGVATVACLLGLSAAPPKGSGAGRQEDPSLLTALEAYGTGRQSRLTVSSIQGLRQKLGREGPVWINDGPVEDRTRRRDVTALLALDAAMGASPGEQGPAIELLEWACETLRSGPASAFERNWMQASIALLESEHQGAGLLGEKGHVRHAISRFPDDPRFAADITFARHEVNVLTRRPIKNPTLLLTFALGYPAEEPPSVQSEGDSKQVRDTLAKLQTLRTDPTVGVIAGVRLGIILYELGELAESRRELTAALTATRDQRLGYLAHLVMGLGFDADNRSADAAREFALAVAIDPAIPSGVTELAQHYFGDGRRADASALLDRALTASPPHDDPWQHSCPDCDVWTARLVDLHASVRR